MTEDGFREFVELRYTDLLRTAYLLTGSRHGAEDLVQSALLRLMRRWSQVHEPMAYTYQIMAHERTRLWRRIGSRERLTDLAGDGDPDRERRGPDVADTVVVRDELLVALNGLPARMRTIVVLRYWEDLSESKVADMLGCSVGTVKSQASRGLARLRTALPAPISNSAEAPTPSVPPPTSSAPVTGPLPAAAPFGRKG